MCDAERQLHTASFVDVEEVHEDALGGFRTEIDRVGAVRDRPQFGGEHQVELANVSPIARTGDRTHDAQLFDERFQAGKVVVVHQLRKTLANVINLRLILHHAGVGLAIKHLIEVVETLLRLLYLLVNLILNLLDMILNQYIRTVTFLGILVVNERIIKRIHMA